MSTLTDEEPGKDAVVTGDQAPAGEVDSARADSSGGESGAGGAGGLWPALGSRSLDRELAKPLPQQFPGWRAGSHRFDGPGGTLVHAAVRDVMASYLGGPDVANDHGAFPASHESDAIVAGTCRRLRALFGARDGCFVFGQGMTTLTTTFVRSLTSTLGARDELVITELDHEADRAPWQALAAARGLTVREAPMSPSGLLPAEAVLDRISARTKWVAVTAASNALGTVPDLAAIIKGAHRAGARVFVDAVQAVAHQCIDIAALGCDAFVTAAYKWYGPHCGVLWISDEIADGAHLPEQVPSAGTLPPGQLSLGTTNFEAVLGTGVAAELLTRWDRDGIAVAEQQLTAQLLAGLDTIPEVRVLGPGPSPVRSPVVTFQIRGLPAERAAALLGQRGISVWHGTFYAGSAMRAVSRDNPEAVRAGIAAYTTQADVQILVDAVAALAAGRWESP
ncbi:aminotransferase class V-fold PLP-dependent enzyme [Actinocrinis sp.]|uniref:aminotransferase class V-fold PLP-dependent enzyme n=1 Tax=Actinocrinis sp. TaxID=1920516 RepID=UPI002C97080D|nr:aminotransferase class V-fold PLP-dependent enzyme [Actinocrinis sp.]HXR72539.1 aminotransferase class V-fold PLP-dependent enzyme [Actinocrinis sp.]